MKKISLILLSLLAVCSLDGGGKTIHRSFRGGYPSAVSEVRIKSVSAAPTVTAAQAKIVRIFGDRPPHCHDFAANCGARQLSRQFGIILAFQKKRGGQDD